VLEDHWFFWMGHVCCYVENLPEKIIQKVEIRPAKNEG
jgi:hypothetical protein